MKHLAFLLLFPLFLSSCMIFHSGNTTSGPLLNVNDQYVGMAGGKSQSYFVLGIGGQYYSAMIQAAKKDMYRSYPLRGGEYYSNISCDFNKTLFLFGIVYKTEVIVSADILKNHEGITAPFSDSYLEKLNPQPATNKSNAKIEVKPTKSINWNNDTVYYSLNGKKYNLYIARSVEKEMVKLTSIDPTQKDLVVPNKTIFFAKNFNQGSWKSGEAVVAEVLDEFNYAKVENGILLGSNGSYFLVQSKSGYYLVPEIKLKRK